MPTFFESVESPLSLVQTPSYNITRDIEVPLQSIDFVQFVATNFKLESVENLLTLADSAEFDALLNEAANNTLTLQQLISFTTSRLQLPNNQLVFTQSVISNIKPSEATDALELSHVTEQQGPIYVSVETDITDPIEEIDLTGLDLTDPDALGAYLETIGLRQSVSVRTVHNISITSYLNLVQFAGRGVYASASNHIHLGYTARTVEYESIDSVVALTQTVVVHSVEPASNELELTQTVDSSGVIARALTDNLELNDVVTFFRLGSLCRYDPGVGQYSGRDAPSMTDPVLVPRSTILLTYPYPIATTTVEIRTPVYDDVQQLEFRKINRKTRGGTLKIFRDQIWPSSERLIYSFDNLKEAKKKEILSFLELTIGQEIGLLDFNSRQWRGIILTPTTQFGNEDRPGNSVTIEFEGVIDPGGLTVDLVTNAAVGPDLTDIPPGFQAAVTGGNAALVADLIRD